MGRFRVSRFAFCIRDDGQFRVRTIQRQTRTVKFRTRNENAKRETRNVFSRYRVAESRACDLKGGAPN